MAINNFMHKYFFIVSCCVRFEILSALQKREKRKEERERARLRGEGGTLSPRTLLGQRMPDLIPIPIYFSPPDTGLHKPATILPNSTA